MLTPTCNTANSFLHVHAHAHTYINTPNHALHARTHATLLGLNKPRMCAQHTVGSTATMHLHKAAEFCMGLGMDSPPTAAKEKEKVAKNGERFNDPKHPPKDV